MGAPKQQHLAVQLTQVCYKHVETYTNEDGITIDIDPSLAPTPNRLSPCHIRKVAPSGLSNRITKCVWPYCLSHRARRELLETSPGNRIYSLKICLDTQEVPNLFQEGSGYGWPGIAYADPFVVYPGSDGPLDSIRWEVFAESLQDDQLLQTAGIRPDSPLLKDLEDLRRFSRLRLTNDLLLR